MSNIKDSKCGGGVGGCKRYWHGLYKLYYESDQTKKVPEEQTKYWFGLNIFYFISHEKGLGRAKMLCHSPLPTTLSNEIFITCREPLVV